MSTQDANAGINAEDERSNSHVAVVNDILAQQYWPQQSPLGACLLLPSYKGCTEVVGVVQNILGWSLTEAPRSQFYLPRHATSGYQAAAVLVRVSGDARGIADRLRRQLQSLSPDMPYVDVRSFEDLVEPDLHSWRLGATVFSALGALALIIATVGLYGVMSYSVSQRTREIGIRMALGASRENVMRQITKEGLTVAGIGVVLGITCSLFAAYFVAPMLYRTSPRDPATIGIVAITLLLAALIASAGPAWRAGGVDPNVALREE